MKANVAVTAVILFCIALIPAAGSDSWTQLTNIPTPRFDAAVCALNGKIYVMGGFKSYAGTQSKIEVYDPDTDTWTEKSPMPKADFQMDACLVNGKIYLFCRDASVKEYDPESETWTDKSPIPAARSQFGTCEVNGKIYVFGGWDNKEKVGFDSLHEYDPATDTWSQKTNMPTERDNFACCADQGKIYALGGYIGPDVTGSVVVYNVETDTWTEKSPMPVPVYYAPASVLNGKIYVTGGYTKDERTDIVQEYDLTTDTWTMKSPLPIKRAGMVSAAVDGKIYIVNGSDEIHENSSIGYTYVYDPLPTFVENTVPCEFGLFPNYPNPFNPSTTITYSIAEPGRAQLAVFDLLGRKVTTLTDSMMSPGEYAVTWNAQGFASGVYICRLEHGGMVKTHKMLLMK